MVSLTEVTKWWRTIASLVAVVAVGVAAVIPHIGLPAQVEENTDSIRTFSPRIEKHEEEVGEILCLLKLTFEEDLPSPGEVIGCGH